MIQAVSRRAHPVVSLVVLTLWAALAACAHLPATEPCATSCVRFDQRSAFGRVLVVDEGSLRYLRFGGVDHDDQSVISLDDPDAVPMPYIRASYLAAPMAGNVRRTLVIGLGGGTFVNLLRRTHPRVQIDAVEIDPIVVDVAFRYFGLHEGPLTRIHIADGATFVETAASATTTATAYDLALLDAYSDTEMPAHLTSSTFFSQIRKLLTPNGVAVLNLSVEEDTEQKIAASFRASFPNTLCLRTDDQSNLLIFGFAQEPDVTPSAERLDPAYLAADRLQPGFNLLEMVRRLRPSCRAD